MMFLKAVLTASLAWVEWSALNAVAAVQTTASSSTSLLDEGVKLVGSGYFAEAVDVLNRFKQSAPQDARAYFYAGIALTEIGRLSAAALELEEAVRLDAKAPEYRIFQANVLSRLKQNSQALDILSAFENAALVRVLQPSWLLLLGEVYLRLEKPENSLRILDVAAQRYPGESRIDLIRGKAHLARGQSDQALAFFRSSIQKANQNPVAYFELGKLLHQLNDMAGAKKALLEAAKQDPNNAEILHKLGVVCMALDEHAEAIQYLERAEPSGSTYAQVYYALGNAYQRIGDRAKAAEYRKRFQEVDSSRRKKEDQEREVGKLAAQGERELDQGNEAEAKTLFNQVLQLDPNHWSAHGYLAEMLLASADWKLAHPHLVKMEEIDPNSVVGKYLTARYWALSGELEKARAYGEEVRRSRPGHAELRNLLGKIYEGLGRKQDALQEYEAAVRLAPNQPEYRENLKRLERP